MAQIGIGPRVFFSHSDAGSGTGTSRPGKDFSKIDPSTTDSYKSRSNANFVRDVHLPIYQAVTVSGERDLTPARVREIIEPSFRENVVTEGEIGERLVVNAGEKKGRFDVIFDGKPICSVLVDDFTGKVGTAKAQS